MPRANTLAARGLSRTFRRSRRGAVSRPRGAGSTRTVERILDGALELLNREGGGAATTNHIAAHLGMSPGNLYYHFRNREEIVRALFARVVSEGLAATALPEAGELTARDFGDRHAQGLRTLWSYRFFFRDLNQLVARDPILAGEFRAYHETLAEQYLGVFEALIAQGDMRAPQPHEDLPRLVTSAILLWFNWIASLPAMRGRAGVTRRDLVEGALHSFLVVAPLLDPDFAAASRAVIEGYEKGSISNDRATGSSRARG